MTLPIRKLHRRLISKKYWMVSQQNSILYLKLIKVKIGKSSPSRKEELDLDAEAILVSENKYVYISDLRAFVEGKYSWVSISASQFNCIKNLAQASSN